MKIGNSSRLFRKPQSIDIDHEVVFPGHDADADERYVEDTQPLRERRARSRTRQPEEQYIPFFAFRTIIGANHSKETRTTL